MKNAIARETKRPVSPALSCQTKPPHRVLVVDDEPMMRQINVNMLLDAGYQADAAEDGAAAWDTLQVKSYDLLITDNSMPKVSGVELVKKVRTAGMVLPVIMATGTLLDPQLAWLPEIRISAVLLKPYTLAEFLGTVKTALCGTLLAGTMLLCLPSASDAQQKLPPPTGLRVVSSNSAAPFLLAGNTPTPAQAMKPAPDSVVRPSAVTVSVHGKCECSQDGVAFTNLERGYIFEEGAVLRTGKTGWTDLFFRRTGTTVRLQADTEIRIENMSTTMDQGLPVEDTLLDLRTGRIFTVVRSVVPGSTLEVRNAAGRSVVQGSGVGRYIITADGTHVAAKGSVIPLKVIGENGITIISAGEQFARKDGKVFPVFATAYVNDLIQLDELQAIAESPAPPQKPPQPAIRPTPSSP